jgi:4-amino-4-deoxy-L-arabinose transferase-like glycosyltransferase
MQLALVLAVALTVRLAAAAAWQARLGERQFGLDDSQSYWTLGRAVAEGKEYACGPNARVFRAPGYPILLAPLFLATGREPPVLLARIQSAVFGALAAGGAWWLARILFDDRAGLWAGLMTALYPGCVAMSILVLSESPFMPLVVLQLILWTLAWNATHPAWSFGLAGLAGVAAGAATLMRPSWLLFVPLAIAAGLLFAPHRRRHLRLGVAILAGLTLTMLPWWSRNAAAVGHFVPTTLQVGASLYDGLNPDATGASNMTFVPRLTQAEVDAPAGAGGSPDDPLEYRLDQRMRTEALRWASSHPGRVLQLAAIKFVRLWNIWPNEPHLSAWPIRLIVMSTYLPILALGLLGAWRTARRDWPYVLCWLPAVYLTLLHTVFVSSIRYREPAMLGLIVLAAGEIGKSKKEEG